jgi:hypothetical protein
MDGQTVINKGKIKIKNKKKHDTSTISHAGFPPRAQAEDAVSQKGNYPLKQYYNNTYSMLRGILYAYDSRMRCTVMIAAESSQTHTRTHQHLLYM